MSWNDKAKEDRARKMALLKEKKEKEEKLLIEANEYLDKAKDSFSKFQYSEAATYYSTASTIFKNIGWIQQADVLEKEVLNMEIHRKDHEKAIQKQNEQLQKEQEMFDTRAKKILEEKQKKLLEEELARNRPSPEVQRKMDRANMVFEKCVHLENKGKFEKALDRYKYLIELYRELHYTPSHIEEIQQKISEIEKKIV